MDDRAVSRVHFVDWLRILAVLLLFPFHTLRVFNTEEFYVKASTLATAVDKVLSFIGVWHMQLLFFLAGASTYFALQKRRASQYAGERVTRLLIPFIFGTFILIPPQTWYGARFHAGYPGSYWEYLSTGDFLRWNDGDDYFGGFGTGHLWFIMWLVIFSLVALPLVVWAARGRAAGKAQAFNRFLSRPWWWLVPVIILFVGDAAPALFGKGIVYYFLIFLLGFAAFCGPRFAESAERYRIPALVGGVALTFFWVFTGGLRNSQPDPSPQLAGLVILGCAATWLMIVGAVGFGKRYLDRTSRAERYLAEGSYPVYILHQTVIVILAFYIVDLAMPVPAQWAVLIALSVLGTFALYEVVRRVNVFRFLFGMRRRRAAPVPVSAAIAGQAAESPAEQPRGRPEE
jgi:glucan biosynthesis protein C